MKSSFLRAKPLVVELCLLAYLVPQGQMTHMFIRKLTEVSGVFVVTEQRETNWPAQTPSGGHQ